jgi:hypothetical protein
VEELIEHHNEWVEIFHGWEEGFEPLIEEWTKLDKTLEGYDHLKRDWNRLVAERRSLADLVDERRLNGTLAKREQGRPIAADAEQRATVAHQRIKIDDLVGGLA